MQEPFVKRLPAYESGQSLYIIESARGAISNMGAGRLPSIVTILHVKTLFSALFFIMIISQEGVRAYAENDWCQVTRRHGPRLWQSRMFSSCLISRRAHLMEMEYLGIKRVQTHGEKGGCLHGRCLRPGQARARACAWRSQSARSIWRLACRMRGCPARRWSPSPVASGRGISCATLIKRWIIWRRSRR